MKKNIFNSCVVLAIVTCCFIFLWGCLFVVKETLYSDEIVQKKMSGEERIPISGADTLNNFVRPKVFFTHDKHINVLQDQGCEICHPRDKNDKENLVYIFPKKMNETNRKSIMDSYHTACIGCHNNMSAGATGCGECHIKH